MSAAACWSCKDPLGKGYRLDVYLVEGEQEIGGPYVKMQLCWPCMEKVNHMVGEQGQGALRRAAQRPPAED